MLTLTGLLSGKCRPSKCMMYMGVVEMNVEMQE